MMMTYYFFLYSILGTMNSINRTYDGLIKTLLGPFSSIFFCSDHNSLGDSYFYFMYKY